MANTDSCTYDTLKKELAANGIPYAEIKKIGGLGRERVVCLEVLAIYKFINEAEREVKDILKSFPAKVFSISNKIKIEI